MSTFKLVAAIAFGAALLSYIFRETFDEESIRGKRVIVTGASTGIGEQLAYWYSRLGARVLVTARREAVLEQVAKRCKELGAQDASYIPLDMGRLEDTKSLIHEAEKRLGGLDHLVLNHVYPPPLQLWNESEINLLHVTMDVNFGSYVTLATYATPMLAKSNGSIAVVSSYAGHFPLPLMQLLSASKFALHGFFGALRHDYAFHGYDISITEHILGSINTSNAVESAKVAFDPEIFDTPAGDTAYRIMKGTAMRERTVYFPHYVRITMLRDLFPSLLEVMGRSWVREGAIDKLKTFPNS
ncbi:hydroxysteroid 11-beta-dehydrogenase 1-like protein [Diadema setosum]|uniref:hydroxysteroid 11-beta-dehydrogenase 1-like protein n=1 Tax=Diadema setosum TaxID=31175 RepID=UPI003B3B5803